MIIIAVAISIARKFGGSRIGLKTGDNSRTGAMG
jgi:hypothetical protein